MRAVEDGGRDTPQDTPSTGGIQLVWDVHPTVVLQLGEGLISDDVQALLELIKNSYDADSSYCVVDIDSRHVLPEEGGIGRITVQDDGVGMSLKEIQDGWLVVSNSPKAAMKANRQLTGKRRTPLGDKGLGRLGVQRLARFVEIDTYKSGEPHAYRLTVDWEVFRNSQRLSQVTTWATTLAARESSGTNITLMGLRHPGAWEEPRMILDLQRKLSQLIFPFASERPFEIFLTVNGEKVDLAAISERIRRTANIRVKFSYDEHRLVITSRYRLAALQPPDVDELALEDYRQYVEADQGASLYSFLADKKQLGPDLVYEGQDGWFVTSQVTMPFTTPEFVSYNPGPFEGEIDSYNLTQVKAAGVFLRQQDYAEFIRSLSGIRVFRDGFGVKPYGFERNDWLGLSQQQTSGSSWYGLRPGNTIGYVLITAARNACLEEVTAREGFKDTPYFQNFFEIMVEVTNQVRRVTTTLRRGFNEYRRLLAEKPTITRRVHIAEIPQRMKETAIKAEALRKAAQAVETRVAEAGRVIEQRVATLRQFEDMDPNWFTPAVRDRISAADQLATKAQDVIGEVSGLTRQVSEKLADTATLSDYARLLQIRYQAINEQLEELTELAGLGLNVETMSHEILNITKDLAERTNTLESVLLRDGAIDLRVSTFLQHVKSSISSLHKQMSHVTPALRYAREQRDTFSVHHFMLMFAEEYKEELARSQVAISLICHDDFAITANRGRLTQVLRNLVLNSQYWLEQAMKESHIANGCITVEIQAPLLKFSDNGLGVDPVVENILFDPFVTTKPKGRGRGLGLFIVRQLLDYMACNISLLPERNQHNRRYVFQLNLSGVKPNEPTGA